MVCIVDTEMIDSGAGAGSTSTGLHSIIRHGGEGEDAESCKGERGPVKVRTGDERGGETAI